MTNPIMAIRPGKGIKMSAADVYVLFEIYAEANPEDKILYGFYAYSVDSARFIQVAREDWADTGPKDRLLWVQEQIDEIEANT